MKSTIFLFVLTFLVFTATAQGVWQQRTNGPNPINSQVTFSINSRGYLYTGAATNNFYQYDPVANSWAQKADYPGRGRFEAAGFATDSFGFIGAGLSSNYAYTNDFYQYDPIANSWSAKANYPDSVWGPFAFCINNTGYFAGGKTQQTTLNRARSYNPVTNTWAAIDSMPHKAGLGFSCVVNGKAYCGLGVAENAAQHDSIVMEYDPVMNDWIFKAGEFLTASNSYSGSSVPVFVIDDKIYISDPRNVSATEGAFKIFDPAAVTWSGISTYPIQPIASCRPLLNRFALTVGNRGYFSGNNPCSATTFWEYNPTDSFVITAIAPDTVCENDMVQFTIATSLSFNSGNEFTVAFAGNPYGTNHGVATPVPGAGSGTYTVQVPHIILSGNNVDAKVSVYSSHPPAQTLYTNAPLWVKRGPVKMNFAAEYAFCEGSTALLLYRNGGVGETSHWSSEPAGLAETGAMLTFTPVQTTTIYATDVYDATGCTYLDSTVVNFYPFLPLQISDFSFTICPGNSLAIGGTAVSNAAYSWTGTGFSSSEVNPVVSPTSNTVYNVVITDTTSGCSVEGDVEVELSEAVLQNICFVTVDSTSSHNVVVWEKSGDEAIDSFIIYREITTSNYQPIGMVHADSLSEFHDYGANPNVTGYRYKISTTDTCGNEGELSAYHNTIHLQYLGNGNLIWNVYTIENAITPISSFDVFYDTLANGDWQLMVNFPGNQSTATDINFSQHPGALYRVVGYLAYECIPTRSVSTALSNIINIGGVGIDEASEGNLIRLFPNPASGQLRIVSDKAPIDQVRILNVNGSLALGIQQPGTLMDVSGLAAGVYIAEVKSAGNTTMKRWVKM